MNIIFRTLILIFLLALLTTCYKGHSGVVEGTVYFQNSNLPVDNADIYVVEDHNGNTEYRIGQTSTDNNGHFKLYFDKHIYKSYRQFLRISTDSLYFVQQLKKSKSKLTIYLLWYSADISASSPLALTANLPNAAYPKLFLQPGILSRQTPSCFCRKKNIHLALYKVLSG